MFNSEPSELDFIAALRLCCDRGWTTPKQLAMWAGVSDRAVHYWLADVRRGEKGPTVHQLSLWCQRLPIQARTLLLQAAGLGSGCVVSHPDAGDGPDLMGRALEAGQHAQDLTRCVYTALADRHIDPRERQAIVNEAQALHRAADNVIATVSTCGGQHTNGRAR